ncbi:MAG: DUF5678 domain-containing protein [Planctomycetota bacterium]|jgi:hypothetical protein
MRDADFAWLTEHGPELFREYAGKWIAVRDGEIIGVGETATEAAEKNRNKAQDGDFILEAIDTKSDVIYGCA